MSSTSATTFNPCTGVRILIFTPKGATLPVLGEGAYDNNPNEGFPMYWWMHLKPNFF